MEGTSASSPSSHQPARHNAQDTPENEALPKQSEESHLTSLIGSNWPSLPSESGSPIPPGQKSQPENPSPSPWKIQQKDPEEYEKDRVGKYAEFFKGNEILPIPELLEKLEPRIVSLVVTDLKTRRLVGLKKEGFEDLLRKAGVPCQYFCRRSFATWDVLLPSSDQAAKVASNNIMTKFFRLQPEYLGTRRIRVTICNVPAFITGEVLAAFLSAFGRVEEINLLRSTAGTAYGDYVFRMCLSREGFQTIPEIIISRGRQMMVIVEGRRPRCWSCKQLGHISKFCPQKDPLKAPAAAAATIATETAATTASIVTIRETGKEKEPDQAQPKTVEEWVEVTRKKKKSPQKAEDKPTTASPAKVKTPAPTKATTPTSTKIYTPKSVTAPIPAHITEHPPASKTKKKTKTKPAPTTPEAEETPMETTTNLKRRRSSGEGAAKKVCSGPPCSEDPLEGPSNALPPKPLLQQAPPQLPFPPLIPLPPPILPLPPPPPPPLAPPLAPLPPPQHHTPQHVPPEQKCSQPPKVLQLLQSPQPPKTRPHQIQTIARAQSHERLSQKSLWRTYSLPSLSPPSSPELFPITTPAEKEKEKPVPKDSTPKRSRQQTKAANKDPIDEQCRKAVALCTVGLESVTDYQLRKTLKPLLDCEKIDGKRVCNPMNFRSAAMVTTFVRSAGDRTRGVWKFLNMVCQTDLGIKLAELEHSSLKKCLPFCSRRVPIFVHPSFYRSLKMRFPLDVGGITRDDRVTTELGTGSLRQAVGILTPKDFRPVVDDE